MDMEKRALEAYEILKDACEYARVGWLRMKATPSTANESLVYCCAAAYLFDALFAKEGAGEELTKAAYEDLGRDFSSERLAEAAKTLKAKLTPEIKENKTPFVQYLHWVSSSETDVRTGFSDEHGLLAYALADELVSLIANENKEQGLRISEVFFLNIVHAFALIYLDLYGPNYAGIASSPLFLNVEENFERIRAEIGD